MISLGHTIGWGTNVLIYCRIPSQEDLGKNMDYEAAPERQFQRKLPQFAAGTEESQYYCAIALGGPARNK